MNSSTRLAFILLLFAMGCSSTANHGIITRALSDPSDLIQTAHEVKEIGPTSARACRFFLLNLFPWGDSTTGAAMEKALSISGGDAILNASVTTSLYGIAPFYNVISLTCTTVSGVAVEIE